jgi:BlaI family penicillinase repressor
MNPRHQLGDLQLAIMRLLWTGGEASATEVHSALLEERGLALTTIKTMLRKMDEKGVVSHRADGRTFIYRAEVAEADVKDGMVGYLVQRLFAGDGAELVHHLIEAGEIDAAELDELRERLTEKKAGQ